MKLTLPLSPEKQAALEQLAAVEGMDPTTFILQVVQEKLDEGDGQSISTAPYEQWRAEFRSWVASHRSRNPQFDDSRDGIYD